jgi:DNA-binding Xre family transcriptional regulator
MSQRTLAAIIEVRPERLARLETGKIDQPRLKEVASIARALSINLEDLIFERPHDTEGRSA